MQKSITFSFELFFTGLKTVNICFALQLFIGIRSFKNIDVSMLGTNLYKNSKKREIRKG